MKGTVYTTVGLGANVYDCNSVLADNFINTNL